MKFAKLYETEKYGQVLITREVDEDSNPCIDFRVMIDGLDCISSISFEDPEKEESAFNGIDEKAALIYAESAFNMLNSRNTLQ